MAGHGVRFPSHPSRSRARGAARPPFSQADSLRPIRANTKSERANPFAAAPVLTTPLAPPSPPPPPPHPKKTLQSGILYPVVVRFETQNYAGTTTNNFGLDEVKQL
jgi:hypothetical protein